MKPPISDPFAPPAILPDEETRVFKHSFWRIYVAKLLASLVFGPLLLLVLSLLNGPIYSKNSGAILLFVMVVIVGLTPLLAAFEARISSF